MTTLEGESRTLIDDLLAEQQQLTAVQRFSRRHDSGGLPAQERYYRALLPVEKPLFGEQYAFGVDLDACTGCKACVSACHSLNGLDEEEVWRNVGFIHGGDSDRAYQQTITTACHHCADPACLNGCPVKAYEKDEATGIVRHLDDQCIGCQYCVLKCPYDVPKYSKKRGIVRKCDMCYNRLAANEAPACVQACPTGAISIRIVNKAALTAGIHPEDQLLPDTFTSDYTKPSTLYSTRKTIPANARASDAFSLRIEHAHLPLILMLVLTQLSAGLFAVLALIGILGTSPVFEISKAPLALIAFVILNAGLAVSVLHLGRPLGAWRAFLGLRTSWMSREIFAFGIFAGAAAACTVCCVWEPLSGLIPILRQVELFIQPAAFAMPLAIFTAMLAFLGVYCSAMIYIDTQRPFWKRELTIPRFFGTTILLGCSGAASILAWLNPAGQADLTALLLSGAALLRIALFTWESQNFTADLADTEELNHRSALTIWSLRRPLLWLFCALSAGAVLASFIGATHRGGAMIAFALSFGAHLVERYFYFTAVVAPRMPGGVAA
ncbi:MAG: hypothetical protein JWL90_4110 [Chthoniobacteraceae bacterium]|nr:hypothetical protein [Chthoniobacteraceae bacterium]